MVTPILETERIILRPLCVDDAQTIFDNWTSDSEVSKFMSWDLHTSVNDTIEWLKKEEASIEGDNYGWGFVLKETGELFGSGGIGVKDDLNCYELGYNIMKKYWNKGLTTEAGKRILEFAATELSQKKFFCRHAVGNIGSQKVMQKLGFKFYADSSYDSFNGKKHFESKDYYLYL